MDPTNLDLDRLEQRIDRLKREYDLFLAGRRRGAPTGLRDEVQREVLRLTRQPVSSTAARFRMKTLAHRFQALEAQTRNLEDLRLARRRTQATASASEGTGVVVMDRAAIENPAVVERHLKRLHGEVAAALGGAAPPSLDVIRERLLGEARRRIEEPGVVGMRFSVVKGDGRPRIRGEVLREDGGG